MIADTDMLGHEVIGSGVRRVIVLNDWLCDTSTWDAARRYLDLETFTWAFTDLRGYGRSKDLAGKYGVEEGAQDVLALADTLAWETVSIVAHSMSTLVAAHLAQRSPERVARIVLLTPPPPGSFAVDRGTLRVFETTAASSDEYRARMLKSNWGDRLTKGWLRHKVEEWRRTSNADAVAHYVRMFARDGLPDRQAPIEIPVLAVTGEQDRPEMRQEAVETGWRPICPHLEVQTILECGHHPIEECPPLTVAVVEKFLRRDVAAELGGAIPPMRS